MKFKTLNNREIRLDIVPERYPVRTREDSKSVGQFNLGQLIQSIYGMNALVLEEFPVPEERLWLDFYLPHFGIAFEYHGEQHDKFTKFFHIDKKGFKNSQERDSRKRNWCVLNSIRLIEVRGNISNEDLIELIKKHD